MATMRERAPRVWQLRVSAGFDPVDGRRRVATETFYGSERAATARLAEFDRQVKRSAVDGAKTTLRNTITAWRTDADHATSTIRNYDLAVATIPNHLLKTPIDKIRAATLKDLYARVQTDHGIHRTRLVHATISGALTYAWRQEWIDGNVARKVVPPAPDHRRSTAPSAAEVRKLLALAETRPEIYAWLLVSVMVGGRPSEILALRWSDVDLERGEISINKALNPVGGGVKSTKTDQERTVAIGPILVTALERWRTTFRDQARTVKARPIPDPYVFVTAFDGSVPWRADLATKRFARLKRQAGVNCRLYDCRHFVATHLLVGGVPAKVVADRLGHTRVATTTDTYGGFIPAADRASAEMLEAGLTA